MNPWTIFMLLGVTALWAAILLALARLAGVFAPGRPTGDEPVRVETAGD